MKRHLYYTMLLSGAVLATLTASAADQKAAALNRVENVVAGVVGEGRETMTRNLAGTIVAINTYNVIPRISGDIITQGFKDGEMVKKGQLLFQIEDTRYQAAVKAAQAKIAKIKAQLDYASGNYGRNDELYKKQAVSKDTWESTKSNVGSLKADLLAAEAELTLAQDDLNHTRVTALYDGKTGKSAFSPGNYITPNSGSLVQIADMSQLRARFSFSMRDYLTYFGNEKNFRENAKIELLLADGSVYPHAGKVEIIDNVSLVASADSLRVWVRFPNPDGVLNPGGAVTVRLTKDDPKPYPAIPKSALVFTPKGVLTYVIGADNKVEARPLAIGSAKGESQIVHSGVKPGEKIIVEGSHKVMPGMKVNPVFRSEGK